MEVARVGFKFGFPKAAYVGACALSAVVQGSNIYTASAGDCKSYIFRLENDEIKATKSNKIFNANKKSEQKRLKKLFPDEEDVVDCVRERSCYVKGALMATRTIGDFRLKFSEFNSKPYGSEYGFRKSMMKFTGPYVTSKPDIKKFEIKENDKFLIMGTDGLWDEISISDICKIVKENSEKPESIPRKLLDKVLSNAADKVKIPKELIAGTDFQGDRRQINDDITIVVIDLKNQL